MKLGRLSSLSLGIVTAVGGFVDMGELVTCSQAGSQYGLALLWTVTVGVLSIMVFADTAGRVAITSGRALFDVIRERLGYKLGLLTLGVSAVVNVLTIVIEICGMALVLQILSHWSYIWWVPAAGLFVAVVLWFSSFEFVENGASILGLAMLVFVVAAIKLGPNWGDVGRSLILPSIPKNAGLGAYLFASVSLLGAFMTPYEVFFYSSGAIEEKWTGTDFVTNRITGIVGFTFGSTLVVAMMIVAAVTFFPHGVQSSSFESIRVPVVVALGLPGLIFFALGAFACTSGAALESSLSTAYTICQFFGWDWGEDHRPRDAPMFAFTFLVAMAIAIVIAVTGVDPIKLTVYTTALAAFSLPFTFIPLLIVANDRVYMGEQANGRLMNAASIFFLGVLCIVTVATIPLFFLGGAV